MSASFILPTEIKNGKRIADRRMVLTEISSFLAMLGKERPFEVLVRPWKKSRTSEQNKALFGLAYKVICEDTGYDKDELHTEFCKRFFGSVSVDVLGSTYERPIRTTTSDENGKRDVLPWDQFSDFYALVERTAAGIGIRIPPPDPMWRKKSIDRPVSE